MDPTDAVEGWRARGTVLTVAGERVHVVDRPPSEPTGEPPLLSLHGFPTSSVDLEPVLERLGARRRVVAPDFPGYGLSAKPDRGYSLFEQADVVEQVLAALGIGEVDLLTHDMGDSVGGELLARSLDGDLGFTVRRRVVTNGSIYLGMAHLTDGQQLLLSLPDERLPEGAGPDVEGLTGALDATLAPAGAADPATVRLAATLVVHDGGSRLLPRLIRYLNERREHEDRWTGAIERHPAPLTIVWGDQDPIAVWPMAEQLAARRPDATLVRLEGVGHYPMLEAPEAFAAAVLGGLDGS